MHLFRTCLPSHASSYPPSVALHAVSLTTTHSVFARTAAMSAIVLAPGFLDPTSPLTFRISMIGYTIYNLNSHPRHIPSKNNLSKINSKTSCLPSQVKTPFFKQPPPSGCMLLSSTQGRERQNSSPSSWLFPPGSARPVPL